ncbi:hypothetical protein J5N97_007558 [Dioscorea zingiberensis]|uniref:DDT domain-containing protein n=1 Tax=Dioscorea zingiberensis TaxID=325984 RepID=A0A9D5DFG4_9LILI|nr:hypothetical protein J5N97_007558 [Dioscorea zingiberensis]
MDSTPLATNSTDLVEEAMADEKAQGEAPPAPSPNKRTKDPGVRHVGSRIYDSENGISCHQCRQKTRDSVASCKKMKKKRPCTIKYCLKCLRNRYGEDAVEVDALPDWECPKCRGICNCSVCMKRRGQQPTGMLIHTAKATGYSSVLELLHHNVAQGSQARNVEALPAKSGPGEELDNVGKDDAEENPQAEKGNEGEQRPEVQPDGGKNDCIISNDSQQGNGENQENTGKVSHPGSEENAPADDDDTKQPMPLKKFGRPRKRDVINMAELEEKAIVLPEGIPLTMVADVEWQTDDAGSALQFLEFCSTFSKVLDIKKGQPEAILREIARDRGVRQASQSLTVQFQMKLLSLILKNWGERSPSYSPDNARSWLQDLGKCITQSHCTARVLHLDCHDWDSIDYDNLESSEKLKILNFLCDETLGTDVLRSWIDEENNKFLEKKKEDREKASAAKRKAKDIKQKMKQEMAKAIISREGAPLSVSEHKDLISKIRTEAEKSSAELAESIENPKKKRRIDAVRTERIFFVENERTYWRLGGSGCPDILAQEIDNQNLVTPHDKWFCYNEAENQKTFDKIISTIR